MSFNRRAFLQRSSLLSLAPSVPGFLAHTARAAESGPDERILLVIQLDGGNDGINTVVPFADDAYAEHRPKLRLQAERLIKLNSQLALHPAMGDFNKLLEDDRLAIVQGVGYPNPSRSHDVSMATWQTCSPHVRDHSGHGWIGRALDQGGVPADGSPASLLVGSEQPPLAIRGRRSIAAAVNSIDEFQTSSPIALGAAQANTDLASFVQRSTLDAYATAERLSDLAAEPDRSASYPGTEIGNRLRLAARLIKTGFGTRVYYTVQSGYDTHAAQRNSHFRLLGDLSRAVNAFLADLRSANLEDRVLVLCFSEFGRRVAENASLGTDHGTAGPVFLAGPYVRPGLHGETPSLRDLDEGDLKMTVDFRRVFATVLERWLSVDPDAALGNHWEPLDVVHA